jgi:hypothetical protein
MSWIRLDVDLDNHPQLADSSDEAWLSVPVFVTVLRLVKQHGRGGKVNGEAVTPRNVRRRLGFPASKDRDIAKALEALVKYGALVRDDDLWSVPGWGRHQVDATNAERQARHRAKRADAVTLRNVNNTDRTGQDMTGQDLTPQTPLAGGIGLTERQRRKCLKAAAGGKSNSLAAVVGRVVRELSSMGMAEADVEAWEDHALQSGEVQL